MTMATKVCSYRFTVGYCSDICRVPTLYLRGYGSSTSTLRLSPGKRKLKLSHVFAPPKKRTRNINRDGTSMNDLSTTITPPLNDHDYETIPINSCSRTTHVEFSEKYNSIIIQLQLKLTKAETELSKLILENEQLKTPRFSYNDIKDNDKFVRFYTGCQNMKVFNWIVNKIKEKTQKLHYFRGESSFMTKKHQENRKHKKGGKKSMLNVEDLLLLTLMRLRIGTPEFDLSFRFKISQSLVSRILSTWIPFLARELDSLIHWPLREDVQRYYPKCFKRYENIIGIIDCTEGLLEKPSIAKAQSQTYPTYKSRNTWKKLVCITPAGTISFIS